MRGIVIVVEQHVAHNDLARATDAGDENLTGAVSIVELDPLDGHEAGSDVDGGADLGTSVENHTRVQHAVVPIGWGGGQRDRVVCIGNNPFELKQREARIHEIRRILVYDADFDTIVRNEVRADDVRARHARIDALLPFFELLELPGDRVGRGERRRAGVRLGERELVLGVDGENRVVGASDDDPIAPAAIGRFPLDAERADDVGLTVDRGESSGRVVGSAANGPEVRGWHCGRDGPRH